MSGIGSDARILGNKGIFQSKLERLMWGLWMPSWEQSILGLPNMFVCVLDRVSSWHGALANRIAALSDHIYILTWASAKDNW